VLKRSRECADIATMRQRRDGGFTLIELLVVMIIIGILAAVAIPVFLAQRAKARDSAVKADVSTLGKQIATWFVDNTAVPAVTHASGRYGIAGSDAGKSSSGVELVTTFGATTTATGTTADTTGWSAAGWCIALHDPDGSAKTFKYSAQSGLEAGQCASAAAP
jgi:type IV pilus assembly protein PilA